MGCEICFPEQALRPFLWWLVDIVLGAYVRRMPYDVVYGGLAAAIGLLIWMYLTAVVVLLGAAYNAELSDALRANRNSARTLTR